MSGVKSHPRPRAHLFVCENRRDGSPLGPGCGLAGEQIFAALKREVGARGLVADVWVTRTHCLGLCPRIGTTVALYPRGALLSEVLPEEAATVLATALG